MKCIFVIYCQEELGFCTLQAMNFIPRDKLHPSGSKKFIPWAFGPRDESFLPSGCNSSLGMKYSHQGAKPNSSFQ